jgi:hypothetical protein
MAARTARKLPRIDEYRVGPEQSGIMTCIQCGQSIRPREVWLKVWAPNNEYCVGLHVVCARQDRQQPTAQRECTLCGHLTTDEAEAALHLKLIHRVAYPLTLTTIMA